MSQGSAAAAALLEEKRRKYALSMGKTEEQMEVYRHDQEETRRKRSGVCHLTVIAFHAIRYLLVGELATIRAQRRELILAGQDRDAQRTAQLREQVLAKEEAYFTQLAQGELEMGEKFGEFVAFLTNPIQQAVGWGWVGLREGCALKVGATCRAQCVRGTR